MPRVFLMQRSYSTGPGPDGQLDLGIWGFGVSRWARLLNCSDFRWTNGQILWRVMIQWMYTMQLLWIHTKQGGEEPHTSSLLSFPPKLQCHYAIPRSALVSFGPNFGDIMQCTMYYDSLLECRMCSLVASDDNQPTMWECMYEWPLYYYQQNEPAPYRLHQVRKEKHIQPLMDPQRWWKCPLAWKCGLCFLLVYIPHTAVFPKLILLDPSMERNYEVHNLEIVVNMKTSLVSPNSICLYCMPWIPKNRYNIVLLVLCIWCFASSQDQICKCQ